MHPTTDAVLLAQRNVLRRRTDKNTSEDEMVQVSMELLWHAMFTLSAITNVDPAALAKLIGDAKLAGDQYRTTGIMP